MGDFACHMFCNTFVSINDRDQSVSLNSADLAIFGHFELDLLCLSYVLLQQCQWQKIIQNYKLKKGNNHTCVAIWFWRFWEEDFGRGAVRKCIKYHVIHGNVKSWQHSLCATLPLNKLSFKISSFMYSAYLQFFDRWMLTFPPCNFPLVDQNVFGYIIS